MYDPHTREPRGFGFVTFETSDEADAAIEGLNATDLSGRVLSVQKARRGRARTPTPGKYFGPPKEGDFAGPPGGGRGGGFPPRGGPPRGGYYDDRYGPPPPRGGYGGGGYGGYPPRVSRARRDGFPPDHSCLIVAMCTHASLSLTRLPPPLPARSPPHPQRPPTRLGLRPPARLRPLRPAAPSRLRPLRPAPAARRLRP